MDEEEILEEGELTDQEDPFMIDAPADVVAAPSSSLPAAAAATAGGGVEEFLKRKREELAEMLKSELLDSTSGMSQTGSSKPVSVGGTKDRPPPPAAASAGGMKAAGKKRALLTSSTNKYYQDLDRSDETQETLLTNWTIGTTATGASGPSVAAKRGRLDVSDDNDGSQVSDGYDEYYGHLSPPTSVDRNTSPLLSNAMRQSGSPASGADHSLSESAERVATNGKKSRRTRSRSRKAAATTTGSGSRPRRSRSGGSSDSHTRCRKSRCHHGGAVRKEKARRERPPCKFFLEGYCREGDKCLFQHVEPPGGRPIRGSRRDISRCYGGSTISSSARGFDYSSHPREFGHWEVGGGGAGDLYPPPAVYGHADVIGEGPILVDESCYKRMTDMPRRKVLLGPPPKVAGGGLLPVPSSEDIAEYEKRSAMVVPASAAGNETAPRSADQQSATATTFDIAAMLRQIKAQVKGEEVQESPASPDPYEEDAGNLRVVLPPAHKPCHRLTKLNVELMSKISNVVLNASLRDEKLRLDPRLREYINSQFEAVSNEITGRKTQSSPSADDGLLQSSDAAPAESSKRPTTGGATVAEAVHPTAGLIVDGPLLDPRLARVQHQQQQHQINEAARVVVASADTATAAYGATAGANPAPLYAPSGYGILPSASGTAVGRMAAEHGFPAVSMHHTMEHPAAMRYGMEEIGPAAYYTRPGSARPPLIADPPMYGNEYANGQMTTPANWMPPSSGYGPPLHYGGGGQTYSGGHRAAVAGISASSSSSSAAAAVDPRNRRHGMRTKDTTAALLDDADSGGYQNGGIQSDGCRSTNDEGEPATFTSTSSTSTTLAAGSSLQSLRERRKDLQYESPLSIGIGVPDI